MTFVSNRRRLTNCIDCNNDKQGHEPYLFETLISEIDASNQRVKQTKDINDAATPLTVNKNSDICIPFNFQQDVLLKKVHLYIRSSVPLLTKGQVTNAYFGLYKFSSQFAHSEYTQNIYAFEKVYQDPLAFNLSDIGTNVEQSITLNKPQTLEAGKVYVLVVAYTITGEGSASYIGNMQLNVNKFLGLSSNHPLCGTVGSRVGKALLSVDISGSGSPIPINDGVLSNKIIFQVINERANGLDAEQAFAGYKYMTVINA